jgi:hypothetical protein
MKELKQAASQVVVPEPSGAPSYVRTRQICGDRRARPPTLGILPISRSTWWQWVADGRAPRPLRVNGCTVWRLRDVISLIEGR